MDACRRPWQQLRSRQFGSTRLRGPHSWSQIPPAAFRSSMVRGSAGQRGSKRRLRRRVPHWQNRPVPMVPAWRRRPGCTIGKGTASSPDEGLQRWRRTTRLRDAGLRAPSSTRQRRWESSVAVDREFTELFGSNNRARGGEHPILVRAGRSKDGRSATRVCSGCRGKGDGRRRPGRRALSGRGVQPVAAFIRTRHPKIVADRRDLGRKVRTVRDHPRTIRSLDEAKISPFESASTNFATIPDDPRRLRRSANSYRLSAMVPGRRGVLGIVADRLDAASGIPCRPRCCAQRPDGPRCPRLVMTLVNANDRI
jgi:hypothetical protein